MIFSVLKIKVIANFHGKKNVRKIDFTMDIINFYITIQQYCFVTRVHNNDLR